MATETAAKDLTITGLTARPVSVPMKRPLATGSGMIAKVPLVLLDLEVAGGVTGRAYVFCYHDFVLKPMVEMIGGLTDKVVGQPLAPRALQSHLLKSLRLLGWQGIAGMAVSVIDMACWDAFAKTKDLPLCEVLGGTRTPVPTYNSKGLALIGAERAGEEAQELIEEGFSAVKVRLGYPDLETDMAVVEAVLDAVPAGTEVMSDYNQCLTVPEAQRRIQALDEAGLAWVEEPTRFDDYAGHAQIRRKVKSPIQTGENCWFPEEVAKALETGASDFFMPDVGKVGGVTGWLTAVSLAEAIAMPISSHLYPEVSIHVLSVTPTRHWLECVDWAEPVLAEPLQVDDGFAVAPDRPGNGIAWDEGAVKKFAA